MINIFPRQLARLILITFSFLTPVVNAALPLELNGKELPSLAPMLKSVTPAVFNIATEGRIKLRQSPLFNDHFFRRFFMIPNQLVERTISSL